MGRGKIPQTICYSGGQQGEMLFEFRARGAPQSCMFRLTKALSLLVIHCSAFVLP